MAGRRDLRAAWAARPSVYPRRTWALILALDRLPWPWGEHIMARCFVARAFVKTTRLRQALTWASAQRSRAWSRWALTLSLCSYHGRFVARSAFTGIRDLATLHQSFSLRGEEHLAAAGRGVIFLGFHLGPTSPDVALRIAGHRVTWIGPGLWRIGMDGAWPPEIRHLYERSGGTAVASEGGQLGLRALYRARRMLLHGENIFITADGVGTQAFEVPLPGGPARIRAGWLLLRQATGAPVLPVLSHMEGRTQVVTVYPSLPSPVADPVRDLDVCRAAIDRLLTDHVRRFPEQCYLLAFRRTIPTAMRAGDVRQMPAVGGAARSRVVED
ncbi:MAG: hypothetical protein DMD86_16945 [Candidatus Rokuibacteriota bacterium]|nr:MAG: hypothetical protein DMD86_16945 [Candidatus Rokubacteria bacterium]